MDFIILILQNVQASDDYFGEQQSTDPHHLPILAELLQHSFERTFQGSIEFW